MTYDYHGWFGGGGPAAVVGHNSPLYSAPGGGMAAHDSISYWLKRGVQPGKLLLGKCLFRNLIKEKLATVINKYKNLIGIPTYGRGFVLRSSPSSGGSDGDPCTGFGLPAAGPARPGPHLRTPGLLGYTFVANGCTVILTIIPPGTTSYARKCQWIGNRGRSTG